MAENTTPDVTFDIANIFDNLIKDGVYSEEKEVLPGFKVKLRGLNTNEMFRAEAEINRQNPNIPVDITAKLRCAKILAYAIISLNGDLIADETMSEEMVLQRRLALYTQLVQCPPIFVIKTYEFYLDVVNKENHHYDFKTIVEETENFSTQQEEK